MDDNNGLIAKDRNPAVMGQTKVIDLIAAHGKPVTLVEASDPDGRYHDLPPYYIQDGLLRKIPNGPLYKMVLGREQDYIDFVAVYQKNPLGDKNTQSLIELSWEISKIESHLNYYIIEKCCQHPSRDDRKKWEDQKTVCSLAFQINVYPAIEELKKRVGESRCTISVFKKWFIFRALDKMKSEFEKCEKQIMSLSAAQMDEKLHAIDTSVLRDLREYIKDKVGNKTVDELTHSDSLRAEQKTKRQHNQHNAIQGQLQDILDQADQKKTLISEDDYGVTTIPLIIDGKKVDVRYYSEGAYNGPKTTDFMARIDFFTNVAQTIRDTSKVQEIRQRYRKRILDEASLDINRVTHQPRNFQEKLDAAKTIFSECLAELVGAVYPHDDPPRLNERLEAFERQSQRYLIDQGRPIIVHVLPDNTISAHFPKGEKTYPGSYRRDQTPGVVPNSVLEVVAHREETEAPVDIDYVFSRASSFSVFGMDDQEKERKALNILNVKQDIINLITLLNPPLKDGDVFEITSVSLLSGLKKIIDIAAEKGLPTYESELRQLSDQHEALMYWHNKKIKVMLNNKEIEISLDINHLNISVKNPKKAGHKAILSGKLNKKINGPGFEKYIAKQKASLDIDFVIDGKTNFDDLIADAERTKQTQAIYFYRACKAYYGKKSIKKSKDAYCLAANIVRSEQLRQTNVLLNCKTSKDRTERAASAVKTLFDLEGQIVSEKVFNKRFGVNSEFSAGLQAIHENSPGARGNRVSNPFEKDEQKLDSSMSNLAKIKMDKKQSESLMSLAEQSANEVRVFLKGSQFDPTEKVEHRYIYNKTSKAFVETPRTEEDLDNEHALLETKNHVVYKPPVGVKHDGVETEDVIWAAIEMAKIKFKVSDESELKFEGKLKDSALALIAKRKTLVSGKEVPKPLFSIDTVDAERNTASTAAAV